MTKKQKIALVVYTALYLVVTKVRQIVRGLAFKFTGIQVLSSWAGNGVSQIRLSLLLRNSLPFGVTVDRIDGDIYVQGRKIAVIQQALNLRIDANSITPVNLDFTVDWRSLGMSAYDNVLSGDIRTLSIQFIGSITAEGRAVHVNKTISWYDIAG